MSLLNCDASVYSRYISGLVACPSGFTSECFFSILDTSEFPFSESFLFT